MLQIVCVSLLTNYISSGDTHSLCVVCLGAKHAESALEGADCPHWERLPLRTLHSPKALFEEGDFTSVPRVAGPAFAEAEQWLRSWESQMDQVEGMKTGESLSSSFSHQIQRPLSGIGSPPRGSSPRREGSMLRLSPPGGRR